MVFALGNTTRLCQGRMNQTAIDFSDHGDAFTSLITGVDVNAM